MTLDGLANQLLNVVVGLSGRISSAVGALVENGRECADSGELRGYIAA